MFRMSRDFGAGVGLFFKGFRVVFGTPRLLVRGALPALITLALLTAALVALLFWVDDLAVMVTPFADDWSDTARGLARLAAGISLVIASVAVGMLTFTALTLAVGAPLYESIAEEVEDGLGGVPETQRAGWLRATGVGLADGIRMVALSLLLAIPLFLAGFLPVVGQTVVPVLGICVNAWLLGVELTGIPFSRRGQPLTVRRKTLRRRRAMVLGFALPVYLLCLVPFAVLVVMPAAMAGGTLLAHRLITEQPA